MRVLVCGGRDFFKYSLLKDTLEDFINEVWNENDDTIITIIEGGAAGADFLAKVFVLDEYADVSEVQLKEFPADWKKYGKAAGSIRNKQMLVEGQPDVVIAFPGGTGTADMIAQAKRAGVEVIEIKDK